MSESDSESSSSTTRSLRNREIVFDPTLPPPKRKRKSTKSKIEMPPPVIIMSTTTTTTSTATTVTPSTASSTSSTYTTASTSPHTSTASTASWTPQVAFDPTLLSSLGISDSQQLALNTFLASQVLMASSRPIAPTIHISGLNAKIPVPEYDSETMTSTSYFTALENYFKSQQTQASDYHSVAGSILKGDKRVWFYSNASSITTWQEFKDAFTARFDSPQIQEARKRRLYCRKQRLSESVEQFVMEMVSLARQINPSEQEYISVLRAKNNLVPELRLAIHEGEPTNLTMNLLLEKAALAIEAIEDRDRRMGRHTPLPLLTGFYKPNNDKNFPAGHRHQFNFRGRGRGFPPHMFVPRRQNPQHFQHHHQQHGQQFNNSPQLQQQNQHFFPPQFRERVNSDPNLNGRFVRRFDASRIKCHTCHEFGHFSRECLRNRGNAMAAGPSNAPSNAEQGLSHHHQPRHLPDHMFQPPRPNQQNHLNFFGRNPRHQP